MKIALLIMWGATIGAPNTTGGTITFDDLPIGTVPDGVYNGGEVTIVTHEQHRVGGSYLSDPIPGAATIQQFPIDGRSPNPFLYMFPHAPFSESTLKYMADGDYDFFDVNRYTLVDLDFLAPVNTVSFDFFRGFFSVDLTTTGTLSTGEPFQQTQKIGGFFRWEEIDLSAPPGGLLNHIHIETFQNEIGLDSIQYLRVPDSGNTALLLAVGCLGLAAFGMRSSPHSR